MLSFTINNDYNIRSFKSYSESKYGIEKCTYTSFCSCTIENIKLAKSDVDSLQIPSYFDEVHEKVNALFDDMIEYYEIFKGKSKIYRQPMSPWDEKMEVQNETTSETIALQTKIKNEAEELEKCYSTLIQKKYKTSNNGEGIVKDGRTLVPVRGVFESLGFNVEWDPETNKASIYDETHQVSVIKGLSYFKVDGNEIIPEVPQGVINGKFYLPLRAIGDAIGAETSWDSGNKVAHIKYHWNDVYVKCSVIDKPKTEVKTTPKMNEHLKSYSSINTEAYETDDNSIIVFIFCPFCHMYHSGEIHKEPCDKTFVLNCRVCGRNFITHIVLKN